MSIANPNQTQITMSPVTSTNIAAMGYDAESQIAKVQFINGGTYTYHGVPQKVYEKVFNASSPGAALKQHFNGYTYKKLHHHS